MTPEVPKRLRVLVVEDSEDDAALLERQLRLGGFEPQCSRVDTLPDLRRALTHEWDLMLSDFALPGFTALDALAVLREDGRDIPVIVVSGTVGEDVAVEAMRAGAHDYFAKSELRRLVAASERELREAARRRQAQTAQRELQDRFEAMANSAPVLIWMAAPDGTRTWFSRPWLQFRGRTADDETGRGWADGVHPDDRERYIGEVETAARARTLFRTEYRLRRADGQFRWMLESAAPLFGDVGEFAGHIGSAVDITLEKEARDAAEAASRLKDEFLATLSHELRTPLNAILGWAHLLQEPMSDEDTRKRAVTTIERNARLQAHLVSDMLDVSRIVTGKLHLNVRPVDLGQIVESVAESLRPAMDAKQLRLERVPGPAAVPLSADDERLRQVVWNLLSNAIKFSPAQATIRLSMQAEGDELRLVLEDEGPGIPAEFLPFVFDRFRQADSSTTRRHGGLGLGLSIVRHLVEAHGGRVEAGNRTDRSGARFSVFLPRRPSDETAAPSAHRRNTREATPALSGVSVLVVEDDADSLDLVRTVLERAGARVRTATSAAEAFSHLTAERPDVLVSDIGMPGESGHELIRRVRRLPPHEGGLTPAAALTAFASATDRTGLLEAGFQRHLPKPVAPAHLLEAVADLAGLSRPPNATP
jgi:PAS domain S-box-containing protein